MRCWTTSAQTKVSWSPDGTQLLLASDGGVFVARPDGSDLRALGPPIRTTVATWSPDASMIAARREYGTAWSSDWRVEIAVMARDGTDVRTVAEAGYVAEVRDWEVRPSNPPPAIDPAACSAGVGGSGTWGQSRPGRGLRGAGADLECAHVPWDIRSGSDITVGQGYADD